MSLGTLQVPMAMVSMHCHTDCIVTQQHLDLDSKLAVLCLILPWAAHLPDLLWAAPYAAIDPKTREAGLIHL